MNNDFSYRQAPPFPSEDAGFLSLRDARNIGSHLALQLQAAGIHSLADLQALGAIEAAHRLYFSGLNRNSFIIFRLEGALTQTDWHILPRPRYEELQAAFLQIAKAFRKAQRSQ